MAYKSTAAVDLTSNVVLSLPAKYVDEFLFEPEEGNILEILLHVFVYATAASRRCRHYISINTERGTIVLADAQTGSNPTRVSEPASLKILPSCCSSLSDAPDKSAWRMFQIYTFHKVVSMAKDKFWKFEVLYRDEGVFTERHDRERCVNRLDEYQE
ncbi:hypothetical protein CDEST_12054 [Colletotrichum destructivum]|uniref:Uncharacterized protein n=1 Tax=Colletotrichum destructivum TaxID=34406 RepID=A0AAX4IUW0_9PEZI|nr:hypothetical protein CDEST_12054 [Colletotrichum destructivum]